MKRPVDLFELSPAQEKLLGKIKEFSRPRPKLTPVYEIRVTPAKGYHLRPAVVLSRKHVRSLHAYECLGCFLDFRLKRPKSPPESELGIMVDCPFCTSDYVEWLSFDVNPQDIYLDSEEEWGACPDGRAVVRKKARSAE